MRHPQGFHSDVLFATGREWRPLILLPKVAGLRRAGKDMPASFT
jgi:hypothetical protein